MSKSSVRWTPEQYREFARKRPDLVADMAVSSAPHAPQVHVTAPELPKPKRPARAKEPNRTEREYEMMLRQEFPDALIRWEPITLRLASRATYTPDYAVFHPDGRTEFHEVKGGYIFPKALVKLRISAESFPYRFVLAQKVKGEWRVEQMPGAFNRTHG